MTNNIDPLLTLKTKVREQSNVFGSLLGLGQFGEYQKTSPALAPTHSGTFHPNGEVVQITFCHTASPHDAPGANVLETEVNKRGDDTD